MCIRDRQYIVAISLYIFNYLYQFLYIFKDIFIIYFMKKKKKTKINKQKRIQFLNNYKDIINKHKNDLPKFNKNKKYRYKQEKTNSWFSIDKFINKTKRNSIVKNTDKLETCNYKQIKVKMILNDIHKQIFQNWFKTSTIIYNETLKYIRNNFNFTKKEIVKNILVNELSKSKDFYNKRYIRNKMNEIKKDIQKSNSFIIDKQYTKNKTTNIKCQIDIHTLDKTIFQLVQNINGTVSNMMRGNIKHFRLKFWKNSRPSKTIELEKNKISNGILCKSIFENLEDIKYYYNEESYDINKVKTDFKINYNSITNEYYLLVSEKIEEPIEKINSKKLIVLDPGLRTFMSCLSENEYIKIGSNVNKIIKDKIVKLNKIKNNKNISTKIKNKNEKLINKKIKNKIDDLHWKTINYLVNGYETIYLGDMSAKSIVSKRNSVLSKEAKTACLKTRYFDFRTKLIYKCSVNKRKFKLVNEYYTSKTCSLCCNYNEKLAGNKIYSCKNCNNIIDRDINGCRNIYMKCLLIEK
jgi:transposase